MNNKYYPIKETNVEKRVINVFKKKLEQKKQEYLMFNLPKGYQNKKLENVNNGTKNITMASHDNNKVGNMIDNINGNNNNKKIIYIEACDTHDKYVLNIDDEENKINNIDLHTEYKSDSLYKKGILNTEENYNGSIHIPLQILSNRYDYNDVVQATNNFSEENKIAKGGNGIVYKGILKNCINVAIKVLKKNENNGFENELIIMSRYRHNNILSLLGYAMNTNYFYLIYEYVSLGDLRTLLFNHYYFYNSQNKENIDFNNLSNMKLNNYNNIPKNKYITSLNNYTNLNYSKTSNLSENQTPLFLSFSTRINILVQIINVLCYLHTSSPIVYHRDLKSANILIDEKFNAKLGDFGLSFIYINNNNIFNLTGGTPGYADPYYISTHEINEQTEIYSFGALILEMLVSKSPAIHVGKNYSCIYTRNEKCPIHCHRDKNDNDDNVFDYLINHINTNDYKSIYSILDYSVNFPDFLVEKLTKLSFLCLNPNIKNRPSSKLVNLILLEIQKECNFFVKKQEFYMKKVNNVNMYFDEYERESYNNSIINDWNEKDAEKKQQKKKNTNIIDTTIHKNENKTNIDYQRKIKNYNNYIKQIKEINYNSINQLFLNFVNSLFGNSRIYNLNKNMYKFFFSENVQKIKDIQKIATNYSDIDNTTMFNNPSSYNYVYFKYNTVNNLTNIRDVYFDKLYGDMFNKNYIFNSFSFNLMNCYFLKFVHDCLKNNTLNHSNNSLILKNEFNKNFVAKIRKTHGSGNLHNKHDENFCNLNFFDNYEEKDKQYINNNISLGKKIEKKKMPMKCFSNNILNIKGEINVTKNKYNNNIYNYFIPQDQNNIFKTSKKNNENLYIHHNAHENMTPNILFNLSPIKNENNSGSSSYDHNYQRRNITSSRKSSNALNIKNDSQNINGCTNSCNNEGHMNKTPIINKYDTSYENRNKYIYSDHKNNNSNLFFNNNNLDNGENVNKKEKTESSNNISNNIPCINNYEHSTCLYNIRQIQEEKYMSKKLTSNKWPLKRNCRDNTPKMVFNIQGNNESLKDTCISNKKKIMRIDLASNNEKMTVTHKYNTPTKKRENNNTKYTNLIKFGNENNNILSESNGYNSYNYNPEKESLFFSKNHNIFKKESGNGLPEKTPSPLMVDIRHNNIVYVSNLLNYINFEKNRYTFDSNTFSWFNSHIFEMIIDENKVISDVTFLDILYEFNVFDFKKLNIPIYEDENKYLLRGKWSNHENDLENNLTSVNLQKNFFFEIAVHHDNLKNAHTIFLLKSNQSKECINNENDVKKKIWISDYIGRRNNFVEKILKKSISNILYECISRKHCLFLLEVQMKTLNKPTCYDNKVMENFSYYYFEYNIKVVCNSENCIFSNNYILYKNNTYSYSLPNNILSLLVFSEDKVMKKICHYKNSLTTTQRIHFPLYPFFVNINFYNEK
ncbi:tyrosine kinase-like protein, putative [Plasmodium berghei]|uniref:Tyrosine kinase-like protein, putative n=2 Tax=Plasmodium berghei TaxID=5821 RepID=A0A509AK99_PLABA|nr:tyrosine kinase-like protein, putative [Plasmodium berghei ANKA]SCM22390.1 tyrosine kinase-like protein, putative [Plasmodium berghei]SCN25417.1 tyrosine kinase-like protein, putative [Plasmodium berghei]SCO62157.1 tyrosine kinase-like protein, putative [Plasmodium berghei]VUC55810.1 tyrosine kinase-like protein, putative [Plasmodium berghei ANKA]|eukprot:XP_034421620.1 tyrosine kinase-like protein, putative [Plasmodium berghei ANKA]